MIEHNVLPKHKHNNLVTTKQSVSYAVLDECNRYLIGFIGWAGIWGPYKERILFNSRKDAQEQIKFMFIDKHLNAKPVKVVCKEEVML
ncbi:MAG: hypothetical protein KGH64_00580 [Candidatus Micrarchaeota archaeon]|nr:hypothetical protein [Candidatus Micrarchaeota archaeon]